MLTRSAGIPPPPPFFLSSSPAPTSFLPSLPPLRHRRRPRCLPVPKAAAFPPRRAAAPLSANNLPAPEQTPPPTSTSTSASPARPSPAFAAGGYRAAGPGEDPLVSKLRTQLGVIHPLPAPPPLPALPRSVLGIFALFFFVGAAFDKLLTLRRRRRAEREVRVNGSWPQVPTSGFSLFLEEKDLQRKESVEWVNMVLGKLWKVYRPGIEGWIVGLLQPVIDNLQKPDYVNRVEIKQFHLGEEPLSVRNVERRTSRRANDLQYQIGIRYAGDARMALALSLKFSPVPIVVPVWVRDFDIDGELWVKLRLIPTEPWVGAVSWAFVSLPKIKFELSLFRLFNLMGSNIIFVVLFDRRSHTMTSATRFLTKLLTEHLPRLFVRPKKIVLDFEKGRAMGPVAGDVASDIIQNVASGIMQGVASDLVQDVQDGNKDFVGELSVTLVDARKLSFVLFGKTDPYVAMILGDQVIKSKKNSQTTVTGLPEEPIWNQDFHMLVVNPRKQKLCIEVKDTVGFTDITIGTGEVDLSSLKDTVPTDKIVTLYGGWGFFGKRSSGEVLLRLTYKAYVEDEEDETVKTEYATGYISDEDMLDFVQLDGTMRGEVNGNERETFMDLLAALLVSEEFQGIVSSAETKSSRDAEKAEEPKPGDDVTAAGVAVDAGPVSSNPEDRALVWLAAITSVMLLVCSNIGGSGYFNP